MRIKKTGSVLVNLGQLHCLKQTREAIALLPLCSVIPLTGMRIPVGSHALPKNKIPYGIINFFIV